MVRPFSFAARLQSVSSLHVKRQILRYSLMASLLISAVFATWSWFRPYAWRSDPAARCKIVETLVTRDQSYFWIDVRLKVNPGMTHDLQKPVLLETADGATHEPADNTFGGTEGQGTTEIWFKFWLEPAHLAGPLTLHLNDGKLRIKTGNTAPELGTSTYKNFTTHHW